MNTAAMVTFDRADTLARSRLAQETKTYWFGTWPPERPLLMEDGWAKLHRPDLGQVVVLSNPTSDDLPVPADLASYLTDEEIELLERREAAKQAEEDDPGAFSPAEQRRFNKLVKVTMLDRETARSIAPDLPESVRDEAWSTLLAAYLHELAVLCRAGRIDPVVALAELQERQRAAEGPDSLT